ncbi:MAG TPA: carboxylesterase family protein [Acidimicrobiales bacterium]|nr:carboxylesterase family protein [Acidimicrobiales bacterium]
MTSGTGSPGYADLDSHYGKLRGRRLEPHGALFAGIPFAAPPVGPLRLGRPQPISSWRGYREAGAFPSPPAQPATVLVNAVTGPGAPSNPEDCLYLNVWTPDLDGSRPVIVWIFGGGFEMGSASPPFTDGEGLMRQTGAVIVAPNYRVGALGFVHLSDLGGPDWAGVTNLGLQDQVAALAWVRTSIDAFGGDPGNVTVAGESAGAFSIGALLGIPAAAGTFRKAILHSGSTQRVYDRDTATGVARDLLTSLGIDGPAGLRDVPVEDILSAQAKVTDRDIGRRNLPGGRAWGTVLDGDVLPRHPHDAVRAGAARDIRLLVGATRDEMLTFEGFQGEGYGPADDEALLSEMKTIGVARPDDMLAGYRGRDPGAGLPRLRSRFLTDAVYRLPASRLAQAQVESGGTAYAFLFSAEPWGEGMGAGHGTDLPFIFGQIGTGDGLFSLADTAEYRQVREAVQTAWTNFTETGQPGWPEYDPSLPDNTRQFGGTTVMVSEPPIDLVTECWGDVPFPPR